MAWARDRLDLLLEVGVGVDDHMVGAGARLQSAFSSLPTVVNTSAPRSLGDLGEQKPDAPRAGVDQASVSDGEGNVSVARKWAVRPWSKTAAAVFESIPPGWAPPARRVLTMPFRHTTR